MAGLWGASWFYDPQLAQISPRLSYLRARPSERGAIFIRLGSGSLHTQRAMQTSPTRRTLIASGVYRPVCYAMFWPRQDLLTWASTTRLATPARHARPAEDTHSERDSVAFVDDADIPARPPSNLDPRSARNAHSPTVGSRAAA